jgi:hypothetical protein
MSNVEGSSPDNEMSAEDYLEKAERAERLVNGVSSTLDKQNLLDAAQYWRRKAAGTKAETAACREAPKQSGSFRR